MGRLVSADSWSPAPFPFNLRLSATKLDLYQSPEKKARNRHFSKTITRKAFCALPGLAEATRVSESDLPATDPSYLHFQTVSNLATASDLDCSLEPTMKISFPRSSSPYRVLSSGPNLGEQNLGMILTYSNLKQKRERGLFHAEIARRQMRVYIESDKYLVWCRYLEGSCPRFSRCSGLDQDPFPKISPCASAQSTQG